jgi:hypothetical protein
VVLIGLISTAFPSVRLRIDGAIAMEPKGLSPNDLIPFIGGRNRVYEVLARKRH